MLTLCSQLCCFDSFRVDVAAASRAVFIAIITIVSISIAVAIASPLALDAWCNRLASALSSSEDDSSTWDHDQRV